MQEVLIFTKPNCPECRRMQKTIRRLSAEPRVTILDAFESKLEAELAGVVDVPIAILYWNGDEQYRTTNLLELL